MPRPSSAAVRVASTAANLGAISSRCLRMWSRTPSASAEELDVPQLVDLVRADAAHGECLRYHALFAGDAANTATRQPAKVIFEVDANMSGRFG